MTRIRRVAGSVLVMSLAWPLQSGCARDTASLEEEAPIGVVVGVAEATRRTLRDAASVLGQIAPAQSAEWTIAAAEPATIGELPWNVGDAVSVGDLLVRFETPTVTANVNARQVAASEAASRLAMARADVNRLTPLFEQGLIARNVMDAARGDLSSAETASAAADAYLIEARLLGDTLRVTARFAGVIAERWHSEGEFTSGGAADPVLRVIDPTRVEVLIELPIDQAIRVREGHPATVLTLAAGSFAAVVTRRPVGLVVEAATVPVRLTAPEVSALAMHDVVQVELVLDERHDIVVVPVEAVQLDGMSSYVMVAGDDRIARRRPVRVGLTAGGFVEMAGGLEAGEYVIVQGLIDVSDGAPIVISR